MKCVNTLSHYSETLRKAKELDYQFLRLCDYKEIDTFNKIILLRHDIDLSLENALKIAQLEFELGIQSTYFVRISAKYNPMFYPNLKIIERIESLGHEIGLHYSLNIPILIKKEQINYILMEKNILQQIVRQKIRGICPHDPNSHNTLNVKLDELAIQYEAYSGIFMDKLKYISDSRASWREGCMCKNIGVYNKLYILTHPFWWYEEASCENY